MYICKNVLVSEYHSNLFFSIRLMNIAIERQSSKWPTVAAVGVLFLCVCVCVKAVTDHFLFLFNIIVFWLVVLYNRSK